MVALGGRAVSYEQDTPVHGGRAAMPCLCDTIHTTGYEASFGPILTSFLGPLGFSSSQHRQTPDFFL